MFAFLPPEIKTSKENFLTTKQVSKIVPYSTQHISRLARAGKIRAVLEDGKWLIDVESVKNFHDQTKFEEDVLADRKRIERILEQKVVDVLHSTNEDKVKFFFNQSLFAHGVSTSVTVLVALLLFFSISMFEGTSQVAQVFSSDWAPKTKNQIDSGHAAPTSELVEITVPFDMANGILLFSKESTVAPVDPSRLFSDEIKIVEDRDGVSYIRMYDGEDFSDIPFVRLPLSRQSYHEVVYLENKNLTF